ncbi:MerR family transcriptional regulator [Brevundimonas pondensis]|uniref:MerR family transcriptional regulator n=1 Tax=Brevundimonas pondensis TaxID=2774189 RepID=A0ABX7SGH7_9CAUL|nr:MerR family transcriptional regulator [Brevundimonas pondensis]QTC86399.1 MerR family transcriptional regulator [Brevundimonas pondensis]
MSSTSSSPTRSRWLGPRELAREANTSIKALRVYEKAGLLTPDRRAGGWRLYGPEHVARLHQVLALKALGLSLKQIAVVLNRDDMAIGRIMELQALHLATNIRAARDQLKRVQQARDQLVNEGRITDALLLELARDLAPAPALGLTDVRTAIQAATLDGEEQAAVEAVIDGCRADPATEASIRDLLAEAVIAAAEGGPGSRRAQALAERWLSLADALDLPAANTGQADALRRVAVRMMADPTLKDALTFLRDAVERRGAPSQKV